MERHSELDLCYPSGTYVFGTDRTDSGQNIFGAFIDMGKAFDGVDRVLLFISFSGIMWMVNFTAL